MPRSLITLIDRIGAPDAEAMAAAERRLDQLTKPPGSLGRLERLAVQIAGITGEVAPSLDNKAIVVMAGDHGVCEEGVSAFPAAVTPQMVLNFLAGGAAVNVMARQAGAEVVCVDIGVNAELEHPRLVSRKVRRGTANLAKGPAMTLEEAEQAVLIGAELAAELAARGVRLIGTGEMGIGNTTPSAALLAVLGGVSPAEAVGRGTGVDDAGMARKVSAIGRGIAVNEPDPNDPFGTLAKLGGLEIAGLVGVILGAAAQRCPVVLDGFISTAAALVAVKLAPACKPYLIASHLSEERGHARLLRELGLEPALQLGMRLGEGTGAALLFPIIDASGRVLREMATFESAGVSRE
ncbi:nicotinate-nucleotide--dimethylbenzimidazole phosphoribosyltransferase [Paenibacillus chartarius]|uniref:Nicotinate-nucleotide--dimethylbenzimidazole phosphoribosyltransferase n=1 Tax=Paenibacillus chartarius TaxID=747481 RepID=A0ABV6DFS4_9BACL